MLRAIASLIVLALCAPAAAMVGGAQTAPKFAHAVVMLAGQQGFCSGAAIARDLVLTAAHCVLTGTDYKLVVFEGNGKPCAQIDRKHRAPPTIRRRSGAAPSHHRRRRAAQIR